MSTTAVKIKDNFSKYFRQVINKKEPVVIYEEKTPEAVLIDYSTYNFFLGLLEEVELRGRFFEAYQNTRSESALSLNEMKTKYGLN